MYQNYYQIKKITRANGETEFAVQRMFETGTKISWITVDAGVFSTIEYAREAVQRLKDLEIVKTEIVT